MLIQILQRLRSWRLWDRQLEDETIELLQYRRIQESPLLLAAKENNVTRLKELLKDGKWHQNERGAVGETSLHVAVQHNSLEAVQVLLEEAPELINQPMTSDFYQGQTALHIATVNENINLVQMLIEKGADVGSPRAIGTFFALSPKNIFYFGEHILTFAACVGNADIVKLLLDHGANLRAQDRWGNTVLHILALQPNAAMCCQVLDFLLSNDVRPVGRPLEEIPNKQGLTPLKLAATEGNVIMFQHLVQKKRKVQWNFGPVTSILYDLTELDSLDKEQSVLELIVSSNKSKTLQILNLAPIKHLLKKKWRRNGRPYFWFLAIVYVLYMICVSLCCVYRPLKPREPSPDNLTNPRDITLYVQKTFEESYLTRDDHLRMCGEIVSVIGAFVLLLLEISQVLSRGMQCCFSYLWAEPFWIVRFCFSLMILVILVLRVTSTDGEAIPMSIALVLGWCHAMYFARGFKMLGPFTIIIQKMASSDLLTFCWLMAMVVFGYSTALFIVFQTTNQSDWGVFYPYTQSLISTYQLFLNILNGPANYDVDIPEMYSFLYASFCVIAFLLMFNLLIAVMGDTQSAMAKKKELWKAQITDITLMMERKLPKRLWLSSQLYEHDLGGKRYLSLEESKWHPLPYLDGSESSDESDEDFAEFLREEDISMGP
ncbi:transient receptor potential cation channel subfamily V member 6 [Pelobates cultripes]|uniref:Transient receptor potential cation channel subfamily V member 6 n=1 Tax=Pelobates cultripes TaxID=61616 RepID=A0AAD1TAN9_PELCU|nr:transient receptor potential cation channel subfamily V member 6 [Pelobates cultripes]